MNLNWFSPEDSLCYPLNSALYNSEIVQVIDACAVTDTLLGQDAGTHNHS